MGEYKLVGSNPRLSVRTNFAVPHLLAAASFSRNVARIEELHAGQPLGDFYEDIRSFSIGCVLTAVAALESYINELYVDYRKSFPAISGHLLQELWIKLESESTLTKYEVALRLLERPPIVRGEPRYQSVLNLIKLRNALVHFKPEWSDQQVEHAKLSTNLRSSISPSPFMGPNDPLFPKSWTTHSCTRWAVESTLAFIHLFEEQAGFEHRFTAYGDRVSP